MNTETTPGGDHPAPSRGVLIVDDNPANVMLLERILRQRADLSVESCSTGGGALALLRAAPCALVFLDLHLPDLSGTEVLTEIRNEPAIADTRVAMVTADLTVRAADFRDDPHTLFFAKPIEVHRVLHILETELPVEGSAA